MYWLRVNSRLYIIYKEENTYHNIEIRKELVRASENLK